MENWKSVKTPLEVKEILKTIDWKKKFDVPGTNQRGRKNLNYRKIWEEYNGKIPEGMMIHHKDGNKENNNIKNLELVSRKEHSKKHWKPNRKRIKYKSGTIKVIKIKGLHKANLSSQDT